MYTGAFIKLSVGMSVGGKHCYAGDLVPADAFGDGAASKLVADGKADEYQTVVFDVRQTPYNVGETAAMPVKTAQFLIAKKMAHALVEQPAKSPIKAK